MTFDRRIRRNLFITKRSAGEELLLLACALLVIGAAALAAYA